MSALQTAWFFLVGVLLIGYAVLDGFDLGVGFWHLLAKQDRDRRVLLNAIGPVWDGNEVWLLTGGGAIFAAFPPVYATVFSGFYLALMLLLLVLILRAVSLEFRSKVASPGWRAAWDAAFSVSSVVATLLLGVAFGNILRGIPLDAAGNYTGGFFDLLNPYALVVGLTAVAVIAMHGALYIALKAPGKLSDQARGWARKTWGVVFVLYAAATVSTVGFQPHLVTSYFSTPVFFVAPLVALVALVLVFPFVSSGATLRAFVASSVAIGGLIASAGLSLYPTIVPALNDPTLSLTIRNSSSSQNTLTAMLVIALVGMPIVLGYTVYIYRTFKGKVQLDDHSY
jgi:cytochrome bd ubiquinol oxidase subunit II